jgi:protein-disulfide isomerase
LVVGVVLQTTPLSAQTSNDQLSERLQTLEDAIRALERQIMLLNTAIRQLPSGVTAAVDSPIVKLDNARVQIKGAPTAKVAMIEFSDLECPYCARYHKEVFSLIDRQFVQSGRIRYGFRHLPIEQIHASAHRAAEAVECAGQQDKFWDYKDRVFANQKALSPANLTLYAREEGLKVALFQSCLLDGKMTARVREDISEAQRLGLTGTPSFLFGKIEPDGTIRVSRKIVGARPFEEFRVVLESLLADVSEIVR